MSDLKDLTPEEMAFVNIRPKYELLHQLACRAVAQIERQHQENERLATQVKEFTTCPMVLCPFEAENVKLRAELTTLRAQVAPVTKERQ